MAVYALNQRAKFDYQILETFEAGLVLAGYEVKSIKSGKVSIRGTYVKIIADEVWLIGAVIPPYQAGNIPPNYDTQRSRKLLLKSRELKYLIGKSQERGLSIIPLRLYDKHGLIKLEIAIGRGKKKFDKRETIKKREVEKTLRRKIN